MDAWTHDSVSALVEPNQLLLAREVDLDAPALSLADDANAGAEVDLEFLFRGARVDVGRCRRRPTRRDEGPPTWWPSSAALTSASVSRTESPRVFTSRAT